MIPRSEIIPAEIYQSYIDIMKDNDFREGMRKNTRQFRKLLERIPRKKIDYAYAEGKWTIRQMLQHIIDAERVFAYRALVLSRMDATPLPGWDENQWALHDGASERRWKDLIREFMAVRESTQYLFDAMSDDQLRFKGTVREHPLNAFTLGFVLPGHVAHHMRILEERYL
jgi:uncharacterized damage-inducible protein DinB